MWSSPIVFRRASKTHTLSDDAKAFNTEARRRVQLNRDKNFVVGNGDRIQIMGEDIDGKTDDLTSIVRKVDTLFDDQWQEFRILLRVSFGTTGRPGRRRRGRVPGQEPVQRYLNITGR
jgi:hypothetical protein